MKTTFDIDDELLARAKRLAKRTGQPVRALVEAGLRHVLAATKAHRYELPDCSVGDPSAKDPLESMSWTDLRDAIYESPRIRKP